MIFLGLSIFLLWFFDGLNQSWKCTSAKGTGQCFSALVPQALKHWGTESQCWHWKLALVLRKFSKGTGQWFSVPSVPNGDFLDKMVIFHKIKHWRFSDFQCFSACLRQNFSCFSSNIRLETNVDSLVMRIYCRNKLFFSINWINYLSQNQGTESTKGTELQCLGTKIQCLSASVLQCLALKKRH